MAALKFLTLASASAVLMANAIRQTEKQSPLAARETPVNYTVDLGEEHVCLDEINAAREAAGLEHFKKESAAELKWPPATLPQRTQHNAAWDPVCEALTADETPDVAKSVNENDFQAGTYAYMALESGEPDCAAAVKHWKDAVNNFTTIPPANDSKTTLYQKRQNISLVAMYNPQENAIADCRVVTCTRAATPGLPAVDTRNTDGGKTGHALLCMTTPEALTATAEPFNEEQWKKIKASITGSASAVAPSLLAVAIAAVGLLAL